jgi:hypothetical protein
MMTIRVKPLANGEVEIRFVPSVPKQPQMELQPECTPARRKPQSRGTEIQPGVFI